MMLINKLTLSASSVNVNSNRRKSTPSMASITPLLQRIKQAFLQNKTSNSTTRQSNTVQCCLSEKQEFGDDTQFYYAALNLDHPHKRKYVQPVENWWSTTPPIQNNNIIIF